MQQDGIQEVLQWWLKNHEQLNAKQWEQSFPVISINQPFVAAIMCGVKKFENRTQKIIKGLEPENMKPEKVLIKEI